MVNVFGFGFKFQNFRGSRTWTDNRRLFFNRQSPHAQLSRSSNQTNSLIHYFTIRSSRHQKSDFIYYLCIKSLLTITPFITEVTDET